ncbi:MAG: DUF4399 domain-containing protein [Gammaproteobacteria bacterium]
MNSLYRLTIFALLSIVLGGYTATTIADIVLTNAQLYIIEPEDGATVQETFKVKFGLSGMGVAPAGTNIKNTGHHHILIDMDKLPDLTKPLPATDQIRHFGGGQTETELTLTPGEHTLQLLLGNYMHIPHDEPVMSKKITITVK